MNIAINAPVWLKIPPDGYGGIELVVHILANKLTEMGHNVTLFASGNSKTLANLSYVYDKPQGWRMHDSIPEILHGIQAFNESKRFDIIHDHTNCGPALAGFVDTPVLCTLHGDFNEDTKRFFGSFAREAFYNAISDYQRNCFPGLNYAGTVYNAIDIENYHSSDIREDFLLLVGRVSPQKGTHLAIEAAKASNHKLIIAGKIDPGEDLRYYQEKVEPLVDGQNIVYAGEISSKDKQKLLSKAKAFLFPIQWAEPFGLVMIEALASGSPVIAIRNGSVPEIINGKVGFVVDEPDEMVKAIKRVGEINNKDCVEYARQRFSPKRMTEDYFELYRKITKIVKSKAA